MASLFKKEMLHDDNSMVYLNPRGNTLFSSFYIYHSYIVKDQVNSDEVF